ncbi:MAG TPA: ABC transporter substrate-binding protein, partial [Beijerinckiaceae bacterium]|nr:ABC transporter substrate-binding protein [Beijerinckiaceae bacterium]
MRRLLATLALTVIALLPAAARPRVVSINMCTDQLLLALADPDQILGLSYLAREPSLSWYWREAVGFRSLSGTAEDVLPLRPDLVFSATILKAPTRTMLRATGLRVEEFASPRTIAEAITQIERAGALLDQPARAAAAIARIEA